MWFTSASTCKTGAGKKGIGIINGIDKEVWDPEKDPLISSHYNADTVTEGKQANKKALCNEFKLKQKNPLVVFIGRLVGEKGADLLPSIVDRLCSVYKDRVSFLILGSGEPEIELELSSLQVKHKRQFGLFIGYDEALAHRIYAGADFIIMPSRVEPCGLNQLYALRYGTMPVVNSTGGLKDTVADILTDDGYGIRFNQAATVDAMEALARAIALFSEPKRMKEMQKRMMSLDFSWDRSATEYLELYNRLTKR